MDIPRVNAAEIHKCRCIFLRINFIFAGNHVRLSVHRDIFTPGLPVCLIERIHPAHFLLHPQPSGFPDRRAGLIDPAVSRTDLSRIRIAVQSDRCTS